MLWACLFFNWFLWLLIWIPLDGALLAFLFLSTLFWSACGLGDRARLYYITLPYVTAGGLICPFTVLNGGVFLFIFMAPYFILYQVVLSQFWLALILALESPIVLDRVDLGCVDCVFTALIHLVASWFVPSIGLGWLSLPSTDSPWSLLVGVFYCVGSICLNLDRSGYHQRCLQKTRGIKREDCCTDTRHPHQHGSDEHQHELRWKGHCVDSYWNSCYTSSSAKGLGYTGGRGNISKTPSRGTLSGARTP